MSSFKVSCSACAQHIECDDSYCGKQTQCPACGATILVPLRPAASAPTATACPGCGRILRPGAVTCQICGYDLESGQLHPSLRDQESAAHWGPPRIHRSTRILLGISLLLLLALYGLTFLNPVGFILYLAAWALFSLILHILILITAARDSIVQFLLCLLIPLYGLYFVYGRNRTPGLKAGMTLALITALLGATLVFVLPPPEETSRAPAPEFTRRVPSLAA